MNDNNRENKKKYGDVGLKIGVICFFGFIITVILCFPDKINNPIGAIIALVAAIVIISLAIIDIIVVQYYEQSMILSKCQKTYNGMIKCVFTDLNTNRSISCLIRKPITFDLIESLVYKVVVSRSGIRTIIIDVVGVERDINAINAFKK